MPMEPPIGPLCFEIERLRRENDYLADEVKRIDSILTRVMAERDEYRRECEKLQAREGFPRWRPRMAVWAFIGKPVSGASPGLITKVGARLCTVDFVIGGEVVVKQIGHANLIPPPDHPAWESECVRELGFARYRDFLIGSTGLDPTTGQSSPAPSP